MLKYATHQHFLQVFKDPASTDDKLPQHSAMLEVIEKVKETPLKTTSEKMDSNLSIM